MTNRVPTEDAVVQLDIGMGTRVSISYRYAPEHLKKLVKEAYEAELSNKED